jgi:hypothetical protein
MGDLQSQVGGAIVPRRTRGSRMKSSSLAIFLASVLMLSELAACNAPPQPLSARTPPATSSATALAPSLNATQPVTLSIPTSTPTLEPSVTTTPRSTLSAIELENYFGTPSCPWPCWQGITPGITTSSEALQSIKHSPMVEAKSIKVEGSTTGSGRADWHWKMSDQQPEAAGNMEWKNGIIRSVGLGGYPSISIGQIIQRLGPPEKIDVIDCTEVVEGPQWFCGALYYAARGIDVHISWERSRDGSAVPIMPDDPIDFVELFEPSTIEQWILSSGLNPQTHDLRDWKGYGDLLELYFR